MASRPKGFGLTRELDDKMRGKYSLEDEKELASWINARTSLQFNGSGQDDFNLWLKDGSVLCALINSFNIPGVSCKPAPTGNIKMAAMKTMKESENVELFLKAAEKLGAPRQDLFQTVVIKDNTNMAQVQSALYAVSSWAAKKGAQPPLIGTKVADQNKREFDEQQQREGRNIIGLQMGSNKGASQAGMTSYGASRQIEHTVKY